MYHSQRTSKTKKEAKKDDKRYRIYQ